MNVGDDVKVEYVLVKQLPQGGMGEVWLASCADGFNHVVIKSLLPAVALHAKGVERFKREMRILRRLHHQNIIQVLHASHESTPPYYIMEYCEGGSLGDHIGHVSLDEGVQYLLQACSGVAYAHRNNILHRDLKPQNLLIDGDDIVRVSDFGLGVFIDRESTTLTPTGAAGGTPVYQAPEQTIDFKSVDARADIYSLGIMLIQILTRALTVASEEVLVNKAKLVHMNSDESVLRNVVVVARRAANRTPEDRYCNVEEMASALGSAYKSPVPLRSE